MENKIILIKFPDNSFHTANVSRFVSIPINGKEIDTIWYIDVTEIKNDNDKVEGSYSIIRDNKDGTFTHLDCGTPENYEKVYEELRKEIVKKEYTNKDLSLLPYSIDEVEDYDFFKDMTNPDNHPTIELSDNVKNIKREISTRIGAFVDPYFTHTYELMEDDLSLRLTLIEEKMSENNWEDTTNDIFSYLALKKLDMKQGYILINDASDALNEIEQIALNNLKGAEKEPVLIEDEEEPEEEIITIEEEPIVPFSENKDEKPVLIEEEPEIEAEEEEEEPTPELEEEEVEEVVDESSKEDYYPYVKTIYVLWNELLSNLANFTYYEYNSYSEMPSYYNVSYLNITPSYSHINKEILNIIKDKELSIDNKNLITINDDLTKYNFYIIPIEDYDIFIALKESKNPYILTKNFTDSLTPLIRGIKREDIIVTEKETISIIK